MKRYEKEDTGKDVRGSERKTEHGAIPRGSESNVDALNEQAADDERVAPGLPSQPSKAHREPKSPEKSIDESIDGSISGSIHESNDELNHEKSTFKGTGKRKGNKILTRFRKDSSKGYHSVLVVPLLRRCF